MNISDIVEEFAKYGLEPRRLMAEKLRPLSEKSVIEWLCLSCGARWGEPTAQIRTRLRNNRQCLECRRSRAKAVKEKDLRYLSARLIGQLRVLRDIGDGTWFTECACGKQFKIPELNLIRGDLRSCGCLKKPRT